MQGPVVRSNTRKCKRASRDTITWPRRTTTWHKTVLLPGTNSLAGAALNTQITWSNRVITWHNIEVTWWDYVTVVMFPRDVVRVINVGPVSRGLLRRHALWTFTDSLRNFHNSTIFTITLLKSKIYLNGECEIHSYLTSMQRNVNDSHLEDMPSAILCEFHLIILIYTVSQNKRAFNQPCFGNFILYKMHAMLLRYNHYLTMHILQSCSMILLTWVRIIKAWMAKQWGQLYKTQHSLPVGGDKIAAGWWR